MQSRTGTVSRVPLVCFLESSKVLAFYCSPNVHGLVGAFTMFLIVWSRAHIGYAFFGDTVIKKDRDLL
jgi:hypothetical protein